MNVVDGEPPLDLPSRLEFDQWLTAQPVESRAVWIRTAKKASSLTSVTEDEMVDVGLCHGWVSAVRAPSPAEQVVTDQHSQG